MAVAPARRIRVARIIARLNVGGPAVQVTTLMQDLDPNRFEQRLLVGEVGEGEDDYLELHDIVLPAVRIAGFGRSVRPLDDVRAFRQICKELRTFQPDIVHTHTAKAGVVGRIAARVVLRRRVRLVHTFHGHLLHGYFGPLVTRIVIWIERVLARSTDVIVAVGKNVRDELLAAKIGKRHQYFVVPPAVPVLESPADRGTARVEMGLDENASVVAFVGRLTEVKRPDRLIEMAALVLDSLPETQFLIAGDGALLDETRLRAQSLGQSIQFLGFRSDVRRIVAASDVVVLTSDNEGMPVSLIEAAASGRACVTTDVGSAREVVLEGRTGFVVEKDPEALAAAVRQVLVDHDLRDRLERDALEYARASFSRQRLSDDMALIYEELYGETQGMS